MTFRHVHSRSGFTLVELIIGMTIFAIGLTGIYALLSTTMGNAMYSRHEIVIANLLREQLELVKNIRDTNIRNFLPWDAALLEGKTTTRFNSGIYIIENDFSHSGIVIDADGNISALPIYLKDITSQFSLDNSVSHQFKQSELFLDEGGRYSHKKSEQVTPFASYIIISPLRYTSETGAILEIKKDGRPQGYTIDARVIVNTRGIYREYDAKTMITDWIK